MHVWQKDSTNTTKPWPRPRGVQRAWEEKWGTGFACLMMRKVTGQSPTRLCFNGFLIKAKWAPYNPDDDRGGICCLPNWATGREEYQAGKTGNVRLLYRHGKLKIEFLHVATCLSIHSHRRTIITNLRVFNNTMKSVFKNCKSSVVEFGCEMLWEGREGKEIIDDHAQSQNSSVKAEVVLR